MTMARKIDSYSRFIAWLKVLLPLSALAILSTLFLLSRQIDPTAGIPFAQSDVEDRVKGQQVTGPFFSGTNDAGDQLSFTTQSLRSQNGQSVADGLSASIEYRDGSRMDVQAQTGTLDVAEDRVVLTGGVSITTTTGYEIRTDEVTAGLSDGTFVAQNPVSASGPPGQLTAGSFMATSSGGTQANQILFTNGVKLIYDPKATER